MWGNATAIGHTKICLARLHGHEQSLLASSGPSARPSVRPSVGIGADPTGRISMKSDIGDSCKILSRKPKFGWNRTNISDSLQEDLSTFYCCRPHKFDIKSLYSSEMKSGSYDSRADSKTTRTRKKCYVIHKFPLLLNVHISCIFFEKSN